MRSEKSKRLFLRQKTESAADAKFSKNAADVFFSMSVMKVNANIKTNL